MRQNSFRLYRSYRSYLKERYGKTAYRVGVDAGFSCPNRGNDRENEGCSYCDERGSRAVYQDRIAGPPLRPSPREGIIDFAGLRQQITNGVEFLRKRYNAELFFLYFQAFSGTDAPVDTLRRLYDYCLSLVDFQELIVATRPDCISAENVELFREYKERGYDVWVELGLQSAHDKTLDRVRRGHSLADFEVAFQMLGKAGIKRTVHLIFGLPDEDGFDMAETIRYVAGQKPEGVKIHNLHIPVGTPLYREFLLGELSIPCAPRHLKYSIKALEQLPEDIIILRLTCDTPEELLAAPRRFWEKQKFYSELQREMRKRKTRQGKLYFGRQYGN